MTFTQSENEKMKLLSFDKNIEEERGRKKKKLIFDHFTEMQTDLSSSKGKNNVKHSTKTTKKKQKKNLKNKPHHNAQGLFTITHRYSLFS